MFVHVTSFTFEDVKKQYTPDPQTVTIPDGVNVDAVSSAINSFSFSFTNGDHHISDIAITTSAELQSANEILVSLTVNFRDEGGGDPYDGSVDVLVLGTESLGVPLA